ncbi:MAG TPA: PEP-CTERM sorting domain-containing protein [Opitutaceae bacterium]|nr:PEP-CTERM sorting domain-containing protein [Opitutaceae bacterium]
MKSLNALVVVLLLAGAASAQSAADYGLLNTGSLLAGGTNPYSLTASSVSGTYGLYLPGSSAWPVGNPWIANGGTAQWLALYSGNSAPSATASVPTVAAGTYTISYSFDLTSAAASASSFEINAAVDNSLSVSLNGTALANLGTPAATVNYDSLSHYHYLVDSTALRSGLNTLEFAVTNAASGGNNPAGLYVAYSNLTVIPEPSTYALFLGIGTLVAAAGVRRFRR